jgi:hypothetical protein
LKGLGLNEEQYRAVCEICDRVLLASDSTIERVAIAWLHVIREHPMFLTRYEDLFEPIKSGKEIVGRCLRILRSRARWVRQLGRSLFSDGQPWYGQEELPRAADLLFVSHLLNATQAGQVEDFYFAGVANDLVARGHSAVIALLNHSDQPARYLTDKWRGSFVPRVILSNSLAFWEEVALQRRLKKESFRLRKHSKKEDFELSRSVFERASEEALSVGSLTSLRIASQIKSLVVKIQPKAIVITHEGHAWERMAFAAARSVHPNVKCIGYQHAALFRLQHAIRRNLASEYNPDQILTAGIVSRDQLQHAHGLKDIPISVLGSNRTFKGNSIKGGHRMYTSQVEPSDNPACLVIPEGVESECYLLFEFSLACAQASPDIQFIWRLHPLVTFKSLLAHNPKLRNLPRNIVLSEATLDEDITRCRWALYRGTTAIVQAVVAGLRPIYLQLPDEMTIDPLYELSDWRAVVGTVSEFQSITNGDSITTANYSESEKQRAIKYCKDFFLPIDAKVFSVLVGI